jgi:PAS domain S-box-containing protein
VVERTIRYSIERARAEGALRTSEARHRAMFDHLPIGLFRIGVDGALLDADPALVQLVGYPDRRTMEVEYARNFFVSPEHRERFLERLEGQGVVRGFESRLARRDGRGRSVYVEGAVEDVSDEREVRDLRSRAARFTWIFAASGVGILVVRRDGTIQDANPQFVRTFGWQRGALRGRPLLELVDPSDRGAVAEALGRITSGRQDEGHAQRRLLDSEGKRLWTRLHVGLVRDANGGPDHVVALVEDVALD